MNEIGFPCEETFGMVGDDYLRCGKPSVVRLQHRGRAEGPYVMCLDCAVHNIANRNAQALAVAETVPDDVRDRWHVPPPPRTVLAPASELLLAPRPTDKASLVTEAQTWTQKAQGLQIVDRVSYVNAAHLLQSVKGLRMAVAKWFSPHLEAATETKRRAEATRKGLADEQARMDAPLAEAERVLKGQLIDWDAAEDRRRSVEEQRLQDEARRHAETLTIEAAAALERDAVLTGDAGMAQEAHDILDQPIEAPVVVVKKDVPKVAGISYRDHWKAHPTVDIRKLARAVADGTVSVSFLSVNLPALNRIAAPDAKVPGVRFFNDRQVVAKA